MSLQWATCPRLLPWIRVGRCRTLNRVLTTHEASGWLLVPSVFLWLHLSIQHDEVGKPRLYQNPGNVHTQTHNKHVKSSQTEEFALLLLIKFIILACLLHTLPCSHKHVLCLFSKRCFDFSFPLIVFTTFLPPGLWFPPSRGFTLSVFSFARIIFLIRDEQMDRKYKKELKTRDI